MSWFKNRKRVLRFVGEDGRTRHLLPGDTLHLEQTASAELNGNRFVTATVKIAYSWDGRTLRMRS